MKCTVLSKEIYCLWEILHYELDQKKYVGLKTGLLEYKFLLSSISSVAEYVKNGNLEKFDALVGENACQIRAIKIAFSTKSIPLSRLETILDKASSKLKEIEKLLSQHSINMLMREGISLIKIIERYDLNLLLTIEEFFLLQVYLLCEAKASPPENKFLPSLLGIEKCSPKKLRNKFPYLSCSFIEKLTDSLRIRVSQVSVHFVRKVASEIGNPELARMVSTELEFKHNNLLCIPTFWSFKALFTFSTQKRLPLVFHSKFLKLIEDYYLIVGEDFLFFKPHIDSEGYMVTDFPELELLTPVCVIEGATYDPEKDISLQKKEWREAIQKYAPLEVLLAAAADHRQYPDINKIVPIECEEYAYFKSFAKEKGFAFSNPRTFFVRHIYAATLHEINNKMDSSVCARKENI